MTSITLSEQNKADIIDKLHRYFSDELDRELGQFEAEFLIDFISKELGSVYYNQGLYDAQAILEKRLDSIVEAIAEIEK